MRNDGRRLLILLLMIAACGAAVYFLLLKPEPSVKTDGEAAFPVPEKREDVTEIAVSGREMEAYTLTRKGEELVLDEASSIELSKPYLKVIWDELLSLEAVPADGEISEEMEFGDPVLMIQYHTENDADTEIRIGRRSAVRDGYYARGSGENVWIVAADTVAKLLEARQDFYIRNLLNFTSEDNYELLKSITVSSKDPEFAGIRVEADPTWFHLTEPFSYICDYKALKVNFLDPAVHLKGTRYITDQKSEEFGFGDPEYTVTYDYDGEEVRVLFGKRTEEGIYVCRSDRDYVFTIRDEDIAFLNCSYRDLTGDSVYSRYINFIDSFRITYEGTVREFDLENAKDYKDKWLLVYNGTAYAYEEYIGFFSALMGIPQSREIGPGEEMPDPEGEVTIEVLLKSGETDTVVLDPLNGREYQAVVNGECHFAAAASGVEALINKLQKWEE